GRGAGLGGGTGGGLGRQRRGGLRFEQRRPRGGVLAEERAVLRRRGVDAGRVLGEVPAERAAGAHWRTASRRRSPPPARRAGRARPGRHPLRRRRAWRLPHHGDGLERLGRLDVALRELARPDQDRGVGVAHWVVASTSTLIATSSPTISPPPSNVLLQLMPKSLRSILVAACAPARVLPMGSLTGAVTSETSSTTSLVTPWSVRSPVTLNWPDPAGSIVFDLKVIVGYFATSRKSALFRCSSRFASRVSMLAASLVAAITAFGGAC